MSDERNDDWENPVTGLGGLVKDKTTGLNFASRGRLARETLDAMYRESALVARVCDKAANDTFRAGWSIKIDGQDRHGMPLEDKQVFERIEKFGLSAAVLRAAKWSRLYGGAVVAIPTIDEDGRGPDKPLGDVKALFAPTPIGAFECPVNSINEMFGSPHFRDPWTYDITTGTTAIEVHRSRVLPITEIDLPYESLRDSGGVNGWGPSIIDRIYAEFSRYGSSQRHSAAMLYIASILTIKMEGYRKSAVTEEGRAQLRQILTNMRQGMDSLGIAGVDTADVLEVLSLNLSNLPDLLDRYEAAFVAVTEMPREILLNVSPAGLNAGQLSGPQELWFATVNAYRKEKIEPVLRGWCDVAFEFWGYDVEQYEIVWPDLWSPSGKEAAAEAQAWAQADKTWVETGAIQPEEIRDHRFVQGRQGMIEVPPPEPPPVLDLSVEEAAEEAPLAAPKDAKSVRDLATVLNVKPASIRGLHRRGEISGWRIGNRWRFSEQEVLAATRREKP